MVLTTHAVGGAATAILLRRYPVLGLIAAFISHFVLDAIPHWHYPLRSLHRDKNQRLTSRVTFNRKFLRDVVVTGLDSALGVALVLDIVLVFKPQFVGLALAGAICGVLPDFLQLIYHIFPRPLRPLQRFHMWIHARTHLDDRPILGIGSQIFLGLGLVGLFLLP